MLNVVGGQDGQLDGTADAVVGAQSGSLSRQPLAVDIGTDGILVEVELHVYELVAYHIHVALQNDSLAILHARCGSLADNHVASLVDFRLQSSALTPASEVLNHLLLALRRAGNFVDLREFCEDNSGF